MVDFLNEPGLSSPRPPAKLQRPGTARLRLGILGGTFDPVHLGHLRAAEEMAEMFNLDQVLFIPAARPAHKQFQARASYHDRLAMLEAAVQGRPGFRVSRLESRLPGPSYTLNTIHCLRRHFERAEFFFLIGMDAFLQIDQWHRARELFTLVNFVVFGRAGLEMGPEAASDLLNRRLNLPYRWQAESRSFTGPGLKDIYYRPGCGLAISSTDLRNRLGRGASIRYLVTGPVLDYIKAKGLYARPQLQPNKRKEVDEP